MAPVFIPPSSSGQECARNSHRLNLATGFF
jgi:hypothetical protein